MGDVAQVADSEMSMSPSRNAPCPCGSGKKTKHCCESKNERRAFVTPAELNQLVALFHAGRHAELENRTHLLLERFPSSGIAWKLLCASLQMQGKDALTALKKAAVLLPEDVEIHINLGNVMQELGQIDNAIVSYQHALRVNPNVVEAHNNLGNALKDRGRIDDAMASSALYDPPLHAKP